jgi:antitoxin Phd
MVRKNVRSFKVFDETLAILRTSFRYRDDLDIPGCPVETSQLTSYLGLNEMMHTWPVQDAKARFSEFLDACLAEGPQMVTRRGAEAAVLVSVSEWRRLQSAARPSLKQLLLSGHARTELALPPRGQTRRRPLEQLD